MTAIEQLQFPKPVRLRDKKALQIYHRTHPKCEVIGCRFRSTGPHHILSRSLGGPDAPRNLIALCDLHHTGSQGPHQMGHRSWFRAFESKLSDEAREKIRTALRLED